MTPDALTKAIEAGIIDADYHANLLERADHWCRVAGIATDDLLVPLSSVCGPEEVKWVRDWRGYLARGVRGIVYRGDFAATVARMRALCGCFLRHYVDARIRDVKTAIDANEGSTILLLPDSGEAHADFVQRDLRALLLDRARRDLVTILHQPASGDRKGEDGDDRMRRLLGDSVYGLVRSDFVGIKVEG